MSTALSCSYQWLIRTTDSVDTTYFCPILLMEPARRVTSNGLFVPDIILTDEYPYPYTHNRVSSIYPIPWAPPATEYFCPIFEQISGWHWQCVPFDPRIDLFQHTAEVEKLVITSFSTPGEDMDETLPSPIFTDIVTPPLTPLTSFAHTVEIFTVDDTITAFSASSAIIEDTRFDASVASGASKLLGLDTINEDNAYTASIECSAVIEDLHDDASELLNFREIIAEDHIVTNTAAHIAFKIPDIIIHAPTPPLQVIFPKSVNTYYEELRPLSTAEDQPATITPAAEDLWNNHFSTDDRSSRKLGWVSRVLTRVLGRWL